jgi:hypothetical protein
MRRYFILNPFVVKIVKFLCEKEKAKMLCY